MMYIKLALTIERRSEVLKTARVSSVFDVSNFYFTFIMSGSIAEGTYSHFKIFHERKSLPIKFELFLTIFFASGFRTHSYVWFAQMGSWQFPNVSKSCIRDAVPKPSNFWTFE